ncbi:MAG: hypothetical protein ABFC94_00105 [Syntrophomonas sp.]
MNDINRRYVDEYIEVMRQQGKSEGSIDNYSIAYDRVFRFKENWNIDFSDYNESIFDTFVIAMLEYEMSDDRIKFITSSISTLAEYLKDKYPDKFGRYFLKDLERLEGEEKKNIPSRALSQIELSLVKELIKRDKLNKLEYIFTVLYYTDIQKSDFKIYNPKCANFENGYFELDGRRVKITEPIRKVLQKVKGIKITPAMILYHFKIVAHYLHSKGFYENGKPFTFDDIKKTREKYFIKCPCCDAAVENIAENWVLVRYDFSEQKVLVCNNCKGVTKNEII